MFEGKSYRSSRHVVIVTTIIYILNFSLIEECNGYINGALYMSSSIPPQGTNKNIGRSATSSPNSVANYDDVILSRYACTRFQPFSKEEELTSNPAIVSQALHCLDIARRAPSGFNAQPYRAIVVSSPEAKKSLSKYCLGPNSYRVLDSDCTVIFLADMESGRNWKWWRNAKVDGAVPSKKETRKEKSRILFTLLFSSGFPLPRIIRSPISFCIRSAFSIVSVISRRKILLPSLTNAETWSVKNTMLFAMTYILSCTSYDLATSPMEGYNMGGIKKEFHIPRRFCIPLIVSTGVPLARRRVVSSSSDDERGSTNDTTAQDYMGVSHGRGFDSTTRFPVEEVIFNNDFGPNCDMP